MDPIRWRSAKLHPASSAWLLQGRLQQDGEASSGGGRGWKTDVTRWTLENHMEAIASRLEAIASRSKGHRYESGAIGRYELLPYY